jgi:hypothetical protein
MGTNAIPIAILDQLTGVFFGAMMMDTGMVHAHTHSL